MRKDMHMPSDRNRILELALESLQNKKKQLEEEIAEITQELRGSSTSKTALATEGTAKKRARFTKEERARRSQRMKAYWDNYRKKKANRK
jgi:uncharacterized protein (UPF0335 family)